MSLNLKDVKEVNGDLKCLWRIYTRFLHGHIGLNINNYDLLVFR